MVVGPKIDRRMEKATARRGAGMAAAILGAAAVFALSLAMPLTIDGDSGLFTPKTASAKNEGGNGGGGNGGGGNGGGGNAGGGGSAGGGTGGNAGGGTGNVNGKAGTVVSRGSDNDRKLLLPASEPAITRAQFTTKIAKRYPADEVTILENPHQAVSFFTELQNMSGQNVTHRWSHGGKEAFKASFKVRADQWRIWSTQLLPPDMTGEWTVEIVNENNEILEVHRLTFAPKGGNLANK